MKSPIILALIALLTAFDARAGAWVPPMTSGAAQQVFSTNLSTSPVTILTSDKSRGFLQIVNNSASNSMACSVDGSTPSINGNGVTLLAGGSATYDAFVPTGAVVCIGSGASTAYNVNYLP